MKSQELVFDDRMVDFSDSEFPAGEPCNGNLLAKENWAQLGSFLIGEDFNRPEVWICFFSKSVIYIYI